MKAIILIAAAFGLPLTLHGLDGKLLDNVKCTILCEPVRHIRQERPYG
jgi:hypothetical protein